MRSIEQAFGAVGTRTGRSQEATAMGTVVEELLGELATPGWATARARSRATRPARRSALRLTRRGRAVVVLAVLVLLVVGFSMGRVSSQAAGNAHRVVHTVTVRPGETLWQIAERVAPSADPRVVVAEIEAANHLRADGVLPGQQLAVP
jgi:nucleoid-associated protein YgaU